MSEPTPEKVVEMPIPSRPQNLHDERRFNRDVDESVRDNTAPVQQTKVIISERGALILAVVLAAALGGMALMRAEASADQARIAERESRVLQERVNDMKVELIRRGIPVSDH